MLKTRSAWYYGHIINDTNLNIDFDEGVEVLTARLNQGAYSLQSFALEVERALNEAGTQIYTVSVDRSTRKLTISAGANFSLLASTGPTIGTTAFALIGFTSDVSGSNSYEGDTPSGSAYKPQYYLQDFVDFEDIQESSSSSVSQSANGVVQVASFGTVKYMECSIKWVKDQPDCTGSFLDSDPNAVANLRTFLENIVQKGEIEFIPDVSTPEIYTTCLLESTASDKNGTGFRIYEQGGQGLFGYFETKKLRFRKVT